MAAVESNRSRFFNKFAIVVVLILTVIYLIPLYWIGSTAFKPRSAATTVPPTVFFKPEVTSLPAPPFSAASGTALLLPVSVRFWL
jgi:multiple sugar transport system permease protein